jgi:polar amino acid transport system substrate-binding protein
MKKLNRLFTSIILMVVSSLTYASSSELWKQSTLNKVINDNELRVCFEAGYMPFEMKAKNGDYIGFDIDIAKMLAKSMGVKHTPVNTAWDGIIPALLTDKCDILIGGMTITSQRNLKVNFADPYIVVGQSLLIKPEHKGVINSYRDLNDSKYIVAAKLGTTGEISAKKLIPNATIRLFESEAEGALEVANGNADALVYDLPSNAIFFSQNKGRVAHLDTAFTYEPLGWAIRKGDPDFTNFLNTFLRQIKGDGTYDRIYDKWFNNDSWLKKIQ